jgi:hypothetical protein
MKIKNIYFSRLMLLLYNTAVKTVKVMDRYNHLNLCSSGTSINICMVKIRVWSNF